MSVLLETTIGDIVIDLHSKKSPQTCLNFVKLCKLKYFNFCPIFKVQKNFTLETGDPLGQGLGGECVYHQIDSSMPKLFKPDTHPKLTHAKRGTVSMSVVRGEGDVELAGSQFFITLKDDLDYLDGKYAVFGEVGEGFDVLDKINELMCDENDRPFQDIRILHTIVLEDPFPDPEGLDPPANSPPPTKEQLDSVRLLPGEELEPDMAPEELERLARQREAKVQSLTLEMLGDLPFAEIKPPENVLFVCKLNQITQSSDLELIFSRFGPITSCEIIRDQQTGDSLCYAFVEFDNVQDCEEAYLKMDNVLIDDRRIHVDFSQSVSKLHKAWIGDRMRQLNKGDHPKYELKSSNFDHDDKSYGLVFDEKPSDRSHSKHSMRSRDQDEPERKRKDSDRESDRRGRPDPRSRRYRDESPPRRRHDSRERRHGRDMDRDSDRNRDRGRDRDRDRDYRRHNRDDGRSKYRSRSPPSRSSRHR